MNAVVRSVAVCGSILVIAGCARSTVKEKYESAATGASPPGIVLVYKFAVSLQDVTENQAIFHKAIDAVQGTTRGQRAQEIAEGVADRMADELVKRIDDLGLPARRAMADTPVPASALAITGRFIDIDEGNRVRRLVIGFGAGKSKVDTQVQVLARSGDAYRTLMEFTVRADSGRMPGAAVTMGAGAAAQGAATAGMAAANVAAGGAKAVRSRAYALAGRSADRIAEHLSKYFAEQGWISPDKVKKPILGTD